MTPINISRLHFPVTTLGPGKRIGIWLQGCSIRCPGCISADTWSWTEGLTTIAAVIESLLSWLPYAEGVTISGGEPFDQPNALAILLRELRHLAPLNILVYSGYPFDSLAGWLHKNPGLIDVLISGHYDERAPQTLALRGSDNQRFHFLTELGQSRFADLDRPVRSEDRRFDIMFDDNGTIWLAGIPAKDDIRLLRQALEDSGHNIVFSESKSGETLP